MRRILICGATGNIGGQILRQLDPSGPKIRALVRDPKEANFPPHVEIVCGDLTRPQTLDHCLDAVDTVFLVWVAAAEAAPPALEHMARRVRRVVFLSAPLKTAHPLFQQANSSRT